MAAPDRVYRYFTNLKLQDNEGTVQYIRCAKPLSSYIISNLSYPSKLHDLMRKFKIDGILWVKNMDNPVAPHSSSDDSDNPDTITIVVDPEDSTQNITMDDPDMDDPDRTGFIAYVYPQEYSTSGYYKFHDIRMPGEFSSNTEPNSINYDKRPWSRASALRFRKSGDTGPAIVLNDAGLNRIGECETDMYYGNPYVEMGDGEYGNFYYTGSFTSPTYNKITSYGVKFKFTSEGFDTLEDCREQEVKFKKVIPKGATITYRDNNPLVCSLGRNTTINMNQQDGIMTAGDKLYFCSFAENEEGIYEEDYNEDNYVIVPRCGFKCHWFGNNVVNLNDACNALDIDANSNTPFNEESEAYLNISEDNQQNLNTDYGVMYLKNRLSSFTGVGQLGLGNVYAYHLRTLNNFVPYKYMGTKALGYHHGALLQESRTGKFFYLIAHATIENNDDYPAGEKLMIDSVNTYYPIIKDVQGLFLETKTEINWFGELPTTLTSTITIKNINWNSTYYRIQAQLYKAANNANLNPQTDEALSDSPINTYVEITLNSEHTYTLTYRFGDNTTYYDNTKTYYLYARLLFSQGSINREVTKKDVAADIIHPNTPE